MVISGSWDKTIRVWDLRSGDHLATLNGHEGIIWSLATSPDGKFLISADDRRTVWRWDLDALPSGLLWSHVPHSVLAFAFILDGKTLLGMCNNGEVLTWRLSQEQQEPKSRELGMGHLTAMAVLNSRSEFLVGIPSGRIHLFDPEVREMRFFCDTRTLDSHVQSIAACPDSRFFLSGDGLGNVSVWDAGRRNAVGMWAAHESQINSLAVSADGRILATASRDKTVRLWELPKAGWARCPPQQRQSLLAMGVGRRSQHLFTVSGGGKIGEWRMSDGKHVSHAAVKLKFPFQDCSIGVKPDSRGFVASAPLFGTIAWDWTTRESRCLFPDTWGRCEVLTVAEDERCAVLSIKGRLILCDLSPGKVIAQVCGGAAEPLVIAISPDSRFLATGCAAGMIRTWRLDNNIVPNAGIMTSTWITALAVSPDNARLISGDDGGMVCVWSLQGNRLEGRFLGHRAAITSVQFLAGGALAISTDADGVTQLWDAASLVRIATLHVQAGITMCAASPEGDSLALSDRLGRLHFLRVCGLPCSTVLAVGPRAFTCAESPRESGELTPETPASFPVLSFADGYTTSVVAVTLDYGIGPLRCISAIFEACQGYGGEIHIARTDNKCVRIDAKNPMELCTLGAAQGTKVQIMVEGTDGPAELMALRLVSALTSRSSFELVFDRFTRRYSRIGSGSRPTW